MGVESWAVLVFVGMSLFLCMAVLLLSRWVSHGKRGSKAEVTPNSPSRTDRPRIPFRPHLVFAFCVPLQAILLLLFAWAEIFKQRLLEGQVMLEPLACIGVISVGFIYIWRKGCLSWK
jgi:NADH:ubiquinone oxidoreductase subunit 3 (subunit A)